MLNSFSNPLVCTQETAAYLKIFRTSQLRCAPGYCHNDITVLIIGNPNRDYEGQLGASGGGRCIWCALGLGEMKGDPRAEGLEQQGEPGKRTESKRARLPKYVPTGRDSLMGGKGINRLLCPFTILVSSED